MDEKVRMRHPTTRSLLVKSPCDQGSYCQASRLALRRPVRTCIRVNWGEGPRYDDKHAPVARRSSCLLKAWCMSKLVGNTLKWPSIEECIQGSVSCVCRYCSPRVWKRTKQESRSKSRSPRQCRIRRMRLPSPSAEAACSAVAANLRYHKEC